MRSRMIIGSLAVLMLTPLGLQAGGNIENGGNLSGDCISCHGMKGQGSSETPPLAGLSEAYILKQLKAFDSGKRKSVDGIMHTYTEGYTDQQLADVAAYWASLKKQ
jgi:cytochrome c553